jgi:hypothetical protein
MVAMTKGERTELGQLIRKREKVMKAQARERSSALLAEFEAQSAKIHHWDEDEIWAKAKEEAEIAVSAAQRIIAKRCKALGIPEEFAPGVQFFWHGRGHNAAADRRAELRTAAKRKIEHLEAEAITKIERMSLEAQEEVVANGLESAAAKAFLQAMPKLEALMPPIAVGEIQSLVEAQAAQRRKALSDYSSFN